MSGTSEPCVTAMPRGDSDVQRALEKAAKFAERQAVLNSAETGVLSKHPDHDRLLELLPWRTHPELKQSCTQPLLTICATFIGYSLQASIQVWNGTRM